ncbi:Di- and tricarboxylate transporter [Ignavibacterium album JCM 16511]|uniref:Di-and tricarboxylate transporter n=1 Tax=Ignavibacterium album (strain DSM 19864 / JCM 16511 / NBRC 101810 / Mat9-16) TaxID=945713 RepID=I0ALS4_IGNAJ|nr:Di- and tricarboxylate transporter [Ignavibacterium album JCM 16511]
MRRLFINNFSYLGFSSGIIAFILMLILFDPQPDKPAIKFTAAVAVLMAIWWMTEALPLAVTALVPLILFPLTGVLPASKVSDSYINSVIFLFLGGFLIAIAMERWKLHRRIALKIITIMGASASSILLGFMLASAFLSMWISNTATAVMMLPIALAVISKIESDVSEEKALKISKALLLGIAYSCSIGGIATLVGTPPNLALVRITKIIFPDSPQISFGSWMLLAVPISVIIFLTAFFVISFVFGVNKKISLDKNYIRNEYTSLGKISFEEKVVLSVFILTVLLWIFRVELNLGFMTIPGWATLLNISDLVDDSTIAVVAALTLYIIPTKNKSEQSTILAANSIEQVPWSVILLFGGGFALANAFSVSGLSDYIGSQLKGITHIHILILVLIISASINFLTELTSNTATTQMILPVLAAVSLSMEVNPLLLMIPATLSASMAFMLPVGTPPNTIVFASKRLRIIDMIKTGFILNISSTLIITLLVYTLGNIIFGLGVFPHWAK